MSRFAIREATAADADGIARAQTESWRESYGDILPPGVLAQLDLPRWTESRRRIARDRSVYQLVAYDVSHGDIVGFCDAGPARRGSPGGEIYALYLVQYAKRHGLGGELLDRVMTWFRARGTRSLIIWVLEGNHHARRFYEARGGRLGGTFQSHVHGYPVVERSYLWDQLP